MGFLAGLLGGLGGAGALGTGIGFLTNPVLGVAAGAQFLGQTLAGLGTRTDTIGLTDAQIAALERSVRRAGGAQIQQRERAAQRQVASQAAQGGTLESGLAGRGFADVSGQADIARSQLEAAILRERAAALGARREVPRVNTLGIFGRGLATSTSPLSLLGMAQLLGFGPGAAPPVGAPTFAPGAAQIGAPATALGRGALGQPLPMTPAAASPYAFLSGAGQDPFARPFDIYLR